MLWAGLSDTYTGMPMAITAEKLAEQYGITREECDKFALKSQKGWAAGELFEPPRGKTNNVVSEQV